MFLEIDFDSSDDEDESESDDEYDDDTDDDDDDDDEEYKDVDNGPEVSHAATECMGNSKFFLLGVRTCAGYARMHNIMNGKGKSCIDEATCNAWNFGTGLTL